MDDLLLHTSLDSNVHALLEHPQSKSDPNRTSVSAAYQFYTYIPLCTLYGTVMICASQYICFCRIKKLLLVPGSGHCLEYSLQEKGTYFLQFSRIYLCAWALSWHAFLTECVAACKNCIEYQWFTVWVSMFGGKNLPNSYKFVAFSDEMKAQMIG